MSAWTGTIPVFEAGAYPRADEVETVTDILHALTDAWTDFTGIAWTSTGTQPAIGNGTLAGKYIQAGKLVHYRYAIVMGSTTTFGTGIYIVNLPVTAAALIGAVGPPGSCYIFDSGTANRSAICFIASTTTLRMVSSADGDVGATIPQTFANGDAIHGAITYEAA